MWYISLRHIGEQARGNRKSILVRPFAGKEFRVDGREVRIRSRGHALILEPVPETWKWLDSIAETVDEDFAAAAQEQPQPVEQRDFEKLFGS